jgi:hypothetical protein
MVALMIAISSYINLNLDRSIPSRNEKRIIMIHNVKIEPERLLENLGNWAVVCLMNRGSKLYLLRMER